MKWQWILPHAGLAAGLVAATIAFHAAMYLVARGMARSWWREAVQSGFTELPAAGICDGEAASNPPWEVRLEEMYRDVRQHSGIQLKSFLSMQYTYYASTLTWTVLAALASLLGVFVIKDGWTLADPFLVNAALTITLLMTFWQAIPKMLSIRENITSAKKSYLSCVQLGNEIRSFARQSHTPPDAKTSAADLESDFINKADKRFSEIRNLNFDIDTSQSPDFRKAIQDEMKTK